MIRYNFWYFDVDCEIDEQIIDAIFSAFDLIFDVETERREDFDAVIEREIISIQNIDFRDVVEFVEVDCFDVADDVKESELLKIDEWLKDDVNINVDSLDDEDVAEDVVIVITVFDVDEDVIDADIASSFDVDFAISLDVDFAISHADFVNFWWWSCTCWCSLMLLENLAEQRLHVNDSARFFAMRACSTFSINFIRFFKSAKYDMIREHWEDFWTCASHEFW